MEALEAPPAPNSPAAVKINYYTHAATVLITLLVSLGGWTVTQFQKSAHNDDAIQAILERQKTQEENFKDFEHQYNLDKRRQQLEIEWLIRNSPSGKNAPLEDMSDPQ